MDTHFWHNIEIAVITIVIIVQIIHTIKVGIDTSSLKKVFSFKLFLKKGLVEKTKIGNIDIESSDIHYIIKDGVADNELANEAEYVEVSLVGTAGKHKIINNIKEAVNTYLLNNHGAVVNFSIIKDIVDREVEVKDDEISQSVTLPLYLGLAATMVGIIFGLFSMPELDGEGFSLGVNALINGVKIAMIGSLTGLACTIFLSSFLYKKARRIVQKEKNEQLTYLQAKLLPELLKAEDTGVAGLKASLDRFAREATKISDRVLVAANKTRENLELQQDVIKKVESMKVIKVTKWNLELFDRMENNMEAFNNFSTYLSNIEQISAQLLEFANKTSKVDEVINGIDRTLNESRELTKFLTAHFEKIENTSDIALKSVGIAESHFEAAIKSLNERTEEVIKQLYKSAGNHEVNLESIYKDIEANLSSITSQYISAFKDAYTDSVPKFKQLENLELIKDINSSVKNMNQNNALLSKLNSIDDSLKKRSTRSNGSNQPLKPTAANTKETISLSKVIKEIF